MGKKIMALFAVAAMALSLAACGGNAALGADGSAADASFNGGFLAATGDYVYFINGSEVYTEDNTDGKVEKGALVRLKKADIAKGSEAKAEVVASKLLAAGDYTSGIYIYADKLYFATPSNEKNKTGTILNGELQFRSVSLSGGASTLIATAGGTAGNTAQYRFVENGGKVYVVYVTTEEDSEGNSKNYVNVKAADGSLTVKEEYASYIFDKSGSGKYVYFTKSVENEVLDRTEAYNDLYRLEIGKDKAEKLLSGIGSNRNEEGKDYADKGIKGVTFALTALEGGYLYFSVTGVDTAPSSYTFYSYINADMTAADPEANYKNLPRMTFSGASSVFASTSMFLAPEKILYLDSAQGLCVYDYTKADKYNEGGFSYGVYRVFYSEDILTATLAYIKDNYLYYHLSGVYYRLGLDASKPASEMVAKDAEAQKLSPLAFSTTWYAPEVVKVGNDEFIVGTLSSADYFSYVSALKIYSKDELEELALSENYDIKGFVEKLYEGREDKDDLTDYLETLEETTLEEFLSGTSRENVLYNWNSVISLIDKGMSNVDEYLDSTYPESSSSSTSSENSGCNSAMGAGSFAALAVFAAGYFFTKRK